MAEYIEREAARTLVRNYGKDAVSDGKKALDPVDDIVCLAKGVDLIPAADVASVVHGKWVKAHWRNSVSCANCSICGFEAYHCDFRGAQKTYNYCPNCGAKMDLEASHE